MMILNKNAYLERKLNDSYKDSIFQKYLIKRNKNPMTSNLYFKISLKCPNVRELLVMANSMSEDIHQISKLNLLIIFQCLKLQEANQVIATINYKLSERKIKKNLKVQREIVLVSGNRV